MPDEPWEEVYVSDVYGGPPVSRRHRAGSEALSSSRGLPLTNPHLDRELDYMLQGAKPMAWLMGGMNDDGSYRCRHGSLAAFREHAPRAGLIEHRILSRSGFARFAGTPRQFPETVAFTLPGQEWRADALERILFERPFDQNAENHQVGLLLGYAPDEIERVTGKRPAPDAPGLWRGPNPDPALPARTLVHEHLPWLGRTGAIPGRKPVRFGPLMARVHAGEHPEDVLGARVRSAAAAGRSTVSADKAVRRRSRDGEEIAG